MYVYMYMFIYMNVCMQIRTYVLSSFVNVYYMKIKFKQNFPNNAYFYLILFSK